MSSLGLALGVALLLVILAVVLGSGLLRRRPDRVAQLRARYLVLRRLGPVEGRVALAERLEALSVRFPGRSDVWYLQWLVTDLERAKR